MTTHTVTLDWPALHALTEQAASADYAATGDSLAGWGGAGAYCHAPESPLGLAQLYAAAHRRLSVAWTLIHDMRAPLRVADTDYRHWGVDRDGVVTCYRSRRGARWSATHSGGSVTRVIDAGEQSRRITAGHDRLRAALRFALAIGRLVDALDESLGAPRRVMICGLRGNRLAVTGARWFCGAPYESNQGLPIAAVEAFVAGGSLDAFASAIC